MATLTYNDITNGVIRLMDEHGGDAQFMSSGGHNETRTIIAQVAENAIRKLHLQAPIAMLDAVELDKPVVSWKPVNGRFACLVMLPDDFLRLVKCQMCTWTRPVSLLWWEDSAEYAKQKNRFLMNTRERPAAFYVHHGIVKFAELYSSDDNEDELLEFLYAKNPTFSNNEIDVADRLKDASLMQVAADTLTVLGENERAQAMQAMALQAINTYGGLEREFADNGNRIER